MKYFSALLFSIILTLAFVTHPLKANGEETSDLKERVINLEKKVNKLTRENRKIKASLKRVEQSKKGKTIEPGEYQNTLRELQEKTDDLQKILEEIENESLEAQDSLISNLVKISGYADAELRVTNSDSANNSFRIRHLSLFFSKRVQEKWQFFSEIEFEDAPVIESQHINNNAKTVQGKILIEQVYIEYRPQLGLELRFGRFLTPAGIWNIFHYYPYVPTQTRPIFIRKIFPEYSDGIQIRKALNLAGTMFDTHFYIANGSGNPGKLDRNNEKAIGARLNFSKDILDGMDAGFSFYRDLEEDEILLDKVKRNSFAVHLKLAHENYRLQTEYATRNNKPNNSSNYKNTGLYAQLSYDLKKWTFAGRYDWYDLDNKISNNDQTRYTAALNYHFAHNVVGKIEYNINEFEDPLEDDYNELITSIVIAIGDL